MEPPKPTAAQEALVSRGSLSYVLLLTLVAALGGLLFGYDTAVISGAIGFLTKRFSLNTAMQGWAAGCVLLGCVLGASLAGPLSDGLSWKQYRRLLVVFLWSLLAFPLVLILLLLCEEVGLPDWCILTIYYALGYALGSVQIWVLMLLIFSLVVNSRKRALVLSAVLFTISAVGAAIPRNVTEFVIARMLGGVGIGIASMLSPLYISEVAPARMRGRLVSVNQFAIIFGMLVVYFANAVIASLGDEAWNTAMGWRWMFASGVLPALLFLVLLAAVPESPRWLAKRGRTAEAEQVLARIGGVDHARREIADIQDALAHEQKESLAQMFEPIMRVPLLIGVGLAILQQITGINVVLYYAPEIFKSAGVETQQSINDTVIVGAVNLAFTLVAIGIVDRLGRKPLLLIASAGMGGSLAALGVAFARQDFGGPWVLVFVLTYVASFAVAMGPVVWVVLAEIFPTRIRGRAMSVATVCLWLACYAVTQFFPAMLEALKGEVFFMYAGICVVAFVFVAWFVPETKGKSLEEIERQWFRKAEPAESSDG